MNLAELANTTVCVTGGTGFVGGRLIEILTQQLGVRVRVATRSLSAGCGLFRAISQGVELFEGDLNEIESMLEFTKKCSIVFHCAYGSYGSEAEQRRVTVGGTRALAEAAARNGVGRFVNISSLVAAGADCPDEVDENFVSRKMWKWPYAVDKRDAEITLEAISVSSGMTVANLRPGPIYGPWGPAFTIAPLKTLKSNRLALVGEGEGQSNAVFVDDVVQAIIRAGCTPIEGFQTYYIVGPENITWRQFYGFYSRMLGHDNVENLSPAEHKKAESGNIISTMQNIFSAGIRALSTDDDFRRSVRQLSVAKKLYRRVQQRGTKVEAAVLQRSAYKSAALPLTTMPKIMIPYFESTTRFSYSRAEVELGYIPLYRISDGMALVEEWARWARLL